MPWITIDDAQVHYATRPGGPNAIVFLHGGFGSSSELWASTMSALPSDWTAYALDNFLRSDPPPGGYTVNALARRAAGFVEALGTGPAVFAAHSMGGVVSQLTAIAHPRAVRGLVLTCTGASMTNHQLGRDLLRKLADEEGSPDCMRAISAAWFRDPPPQPFFDEYVSRAQTAPLDAMIDVQASLIETDLRDQLGKINVPALVMFGAHDTGRTIDHARTLIAGIRGATLATMHDSGHTPMIETPDAYNAALHPFLHSIAEGHTHA